MQQSNWARARSLLDALLKRSPGDAEARLLRIQCMAGAGQLEAAVREAGRWARQLELAASDSGADLLAKVRDERQKAEAELSRRRELEAARAAAAEEARRLEQQRQREEARRARAAAEEAARKRAEEAQQRTQRLQMAEAERQRREGERRREGLAASDPSMSSRNEFEGSPPAASAASAASAAAPPAPASAAGDPEGECAICLEPLGAGTGPGPSGAPLPCGHQNLFHAGCIGVWRAHSGGTASTCPACRTPLSAAGIGPASDSTPSLPAPAPAARADEPAPPGIEPGPIEFGYPGPSSLPAPAASSSSSSAVPPPPPAAAGVLSVPPSAQMAPPPSVSPPVSHAPVPLHMHPGPISSAPYPAEPWASSGYAFAPPPGYPPRAPAFAPGAASPTPRIARPYLPPGGPPVRPTRPYDPFNRGAGPSRTYVDFLVQPKPKGLEALFEKKKLRLAEGGSICLHAEFEVPEGQHPQQTVAALCRAVATVVRSASYSFSKPEGPRKATVKLYGLEARRYISEDIDVNSEDLRTLQQYFLGALRALQPPEGTVTGLRSLNIAICYPRDPQDLRAERVPLHGMPWPPAAELRAALAPFGSLKSLALFFDNLDVGVLPEDAAAIAAACPLLQSICIHPHFTSSERRTP
eukprot:tig00020603_g11791.t1